MLQGTRRIAAATVLASVLVLLWTSAEARTQPADLSRESLFPFTILALPGDPFAHAQPVLGHDAADEAAPAVSRGRFRAPAPDSTEGAPEAGSSGTGRTSARPAAGWTGALDPILSKSPRSFLFPFGAPPDAG